MCVNLLPRGQSNSIYGMRSSGGSWKPSSSCDWLGSHVLHSMFSSYDWLSRLYVLFLGAYGMHAYNFLPALTDSNLLRGRVGDSRK
jgi:hypothetical protein